MDNSQELISKYVTDNQTKLYRTAYMYLGEREGALDALQDAIVSALKSASSLRQPEYVGTWFYRILINKCVTELKRRKRTAMPEVPIEEMPSQPDADRAEIMDLYRGIGRLDATHRIVILLRYFEDMKISDIAKITDSNESTVKSRLKAALERLRLQIKAEV
jgi:RNA polymerase sigma-70 factor (ECF subfamily)